jgi:uncharacterized damage-inducible protein DinB
MKKTPWIERQFAPETPPSMFPVVLERLRGTPARLEDRFRGVPGDILTRQTDGKWSIQENAGHLLQLEPLWLGRLDDFVSGAGVLRAADMSNTATHEARYNERPVASILSEFRALRGESVTRLERLDDAVLLHVAEHPRLRRPMRVIDMMAFVAEHDDHHLARISEILNAAGPA